MRQVSWAVLAVALGFPVAVLAQETGAPKPPVKANVASKTVSEIVVTARRLNEARASIQPRIGASVYTINSNAIAVMPQGQNTSMNQVLLQAPGVAEDSYSQIHVRGEHNGLQYRLNGVILPEGLSVFSQALNPRLADQVQLITGALPAEYGLRTAGIIDITTKSGLANGGDMSIYGGSQDHIQPSIEYGGTSGTFSYFASLSYLHDALGIESPDTSAVPLHDNTDQYQGFAYLEDILDPNSRISAILGASNQRFQIPNQVGQTPSLFFGPDGDQPLKVDGQTTYPSADLNESQKEKTYFAVLSYLHTAGAFTGQISLFARYSTLTFVPDDLGDLLFNGVAQAAQKSDTAGGVQAEGEYHFGEAHTVRAGLIAEVDRAVSDTTSQVIALDPNTNSQVSSFGVPETIIDDTAKTAVTLSAYIQDEWKILSNLTLNYGLRFDQFDGYRDQNQLSPRVNLVWKPFEDTTFHAGYARYFSPPPFELIGQETVNKFNNTTAASEVTTDTTPYAERANYYDVGVSQSLLDHALTLGIDTYYKQDKDLIDEGQFGAPIILTPFNYAVGRQYGVELTGSYAHGPFTAYANFAAQSAKGKDIISSQFNFAADDLAYIADHFINLDNSASYTASGGVSYLWRGTRVGGDLLYGSGLRADLALPDGAVIPNGLELPSYVQVNLSLSHRFDNVPGGALTVRFDVINAFDKIIEIRDGTGVGVFAPQYGPRRGFFAGVTKDF
ncbi:MAG: TonB-dependent receptor [Caulobacteraceae bacterium]